MSESAIFADPQNSLPRFPRSPAVLLAVPLALGILADRDVFRATSTTWATALLVALAVTAAAHMLGRRRIAAMSLLATFFVLGGARHHQQWSIVAPDDVRLFARTAPRLVRLRGVVDESPWIRRARQGPMQASWAQIDHTVGVLRCREILSDAGPIAVSGRVRFDVDGHVLHVETSDLVEVTGWLSLAAPPSNPGDFDLGETLRRQGVGAIVSADHPEAVRRIEAEPGVGPYVRRTISRLRSDGDALFVQRLSKSNAPVASALLLGDRSGLTDELRSAFAESGMTHVLAISGLNVGILATLVWPLCRLWNARPVTTAAVLGSVAICYAALTDASPPVVRATVILLAMAVAMPWNRGVSAVNALGVAALVVLLWCPTDLFDAGAQLSFLAVAGMVWVGRFTRSRPFVQGPAVPQTLTGALWAKAVSFVRESCLLMGAVWAFTLPIVLARFHILSTSGLFLNLVLMPFVTVVMWLGYLTLLVGLLVPPAAVVFSVPFDHGLSFFLWSVEKAAAVKVGHLDVPPPPAWWLAGHYAILAAMFFAAHRFRISVRLMQGLAAWTAVGLAVGLAPAPSEGLRCTFLAVGHGGAVLLELPDGRTLLYDAGSLQNPQRAERVIETVLWERGRHRLDAVILSHADIDHFNAVPGLLERIPVGRLFVGRSFLDFGQEPVRECCEAAFHRQVPLRLIRQGDRLEVGPDVTVRVLHPPDPWDTHTRPSDNASSLVVVVEYAGRRILLTGDLEKEGTSRLTESEPLDVDVLQAPHHGSLPSNPKSLKDWATPEHVVASGGRNVPREALQKLYGDEARVLTTFDHGATTFEIDPDGTMRVTTMR